MPFSSTTCSPTTAARRKKREKVACLFERQGAGVSWRHFDFITGGTESRRARELVLRQIAAVGNYDYLFDWTFQQDGTIRIAVGATGIAEVKGVAAKSMADPEGAKAAAYGHFVSEHTVAINHDHFLNFRLDLDVDGEKNSFVDDQLKRVKLEGTRKSLWVEQPRTLKREQEARLHMSMEAPSLWRVVNPIALGPVGYPVGYELMPGHNAMSLLAPEDFPSRRAGSRRTTCGSRHTRPTNDGGRPISEPEQRRRRTTDLDEGQPLDRKHRHRSLVHRRLPPHRARGRLAGHADLLARVPAPPVRLLREKPGPRRTEAVAYSVLSEVRSCRTNVQDH